MYIKKYIRNDKGQPIGMMVADLINDKISFGWSLTHRNDRYSKDQGTRIAFGRLTANATRSSVVVPSMILSDMQAFKLNAIKFFKRDSEVTVVSAI